MKADSPARRRRALRRGAAATTSATAIASLVAAPASAVAAPAPPPPSGQPATQTAPEQLRASASRHVLAGHRATVSGSSGSGAPQRPLVIEARSRGGGWRTVTRTRTDAAGHFRASWRPSKPGAYRLRVRDAGSATSPASAGRLTVYRSVLASFYGPGLYGGALACGGTLSPGTLGVANKTLPCGTRVSLRYGRRTVTVPVIDRGPYVAGRTYDLTTATKERLGFPSTGAVWSSR